MYMVDTYQVVENWEGEIVIGKRRLNNLYYAENKQEMTEFIDRIEEERISFGPRLVKTSKN